MYFADGVQTESALVLAEIDLSNIAKIALFLIGIAVWLGKVLIERSSSTSEEHSAAPTWTPQQPTNSGHPNFTGHPNSPYPPPGYPQPGYGTPASSTMTRSTEQDYDPDKPQVMEAVVAVRTETPAAAAGRMDRPLELSAQERRAELGARPEPREVPSRPPPPSVAPGLSQGQLKNWEAIAARIQGQAAQAAESAKAAAQAAVHVAAEPTADTQASVAAPSIRPRTGVNLAARLLNARGRQPLASMMIWSEVFGPPPGLRPGGAEFARRI